MNRFLSLILLGVVFMETAGFAQVKAPFLPYGETPIVLTKQEEQTLNALFARKGEIYFTFTIQDKSELRELTKLISIDNVKNGVVSSIANKKEFAAFLSLHRPYILQSNPNELQKVKMIDAKHAKQLNTWDAYPTYSAYEAIMQQFATDYPSICKLVTLATLPSGRKLLALKITDNVNVREDEPQFLYTSSMHGDEIAGYVGMLHYIDYLLQNYGMNPKITYLVNNMEIWINPSANPDGTYAGGNATVNGATRSNANNIDLNRNYPDPQDGAHPDGNAYQPETVAFMAFADTMDFVMAANFHGGSEVINYPWDTYVRQHADTNWWVRESTKYADTAQVHSPAGYFTDVAASGITNGFLWYEVNGGRQDYMNYFQHCREFTVELSMTKILQPANLLANWEYNYRSWLGYMEEALYGVRGVVKDGCTNLPIRAKVFVDGHDLDSSEVYSSKKSGSYFRPIFQGTYTITYSAPGYISQTITGVTVVDKQSTRRDIVLMPAVPRANFATASTTICGNTASFTDFSGSSTAWNWSFGDGSSSTLQNPTHNYAASGIYTVKLVVSNCAGRDSLTQTNYLTVTIPTPPTIANATICANQTAVLTATSNGTTNWYSAATNGTPFYNGGSYTTPILSNTTTYFVENEEAGVLQHAGASSNAIGVGGYYTGATYHYLRFTSAATFKLLSVAVTANTAGNRTIELRNNANVVLQTKTVAVPVGASRVTLNFDVPIGTDLQLGVAGANNLYRNSAGASYPYTLNNTLTITGNSANNANVYYYFYDWELQKPCKSMRIPITATVNAIPASPVITESGGVLSTTALGTTQWYNQATGAIPGATGSSYTPVVSGVYYAVQLGAGFCNSANSNTINVVITNTNADAIEKLEAITVFPSPNHGRFQVNLNGVEAAEKTVLIYATTGQLVYKTTTNAKILSIELSSIAKGAYLIEVYDMQNQRIGTGKCIVE